MRICLLIVGLALLGGCGGWDMPSYPPTDVVPEFSYYQFITSRPINDGNHRAFDFSVVRDSTTGEPVLRFSSDSWRYDQIPISRGAFSWDWGQIDGTNCPTDAYSISGHFTSPDRAAGTIKIGSNCQGTAVATFVATATTPITYP